MITESINLEVLDRTATEVVGPLRLHMEVEHWPLAVPFRISGFVFERIPLLVVRLQMQGKVGVAEAAGVYYLKETPESMAAQIEAVQAALEGGVSRARLRTLLPPGGARNALDCALWDLQARVAGVRVWQFAGLNAPRALITTFTCGADTPERMAAAACAYRGARAIKLKLTGEALDASRVREVRRARPDVWLGVDANQGFSAATLEDLMPTLLEAEVKLIEQPFPRGHDGLLDDLVSPIPIAADESLQSLAELPSLVGRFQAANIKLDKCGGLTEALAMVRAARKLGLAPMIGNMLGTSLSMAPAYLVGQLCDLVDLDGAIFLRGDRPSGLRYEDGVVSYAHGLWG